MDLSIETEVHLFGVKRKKKSILAPMGFKNDKSLAQGRAFLN